MLLRCLAVHKIIHEILESNAWRDGEFAKFKANQSKVDPTLWNRMCVPMIYAHWEGFTVSALRILLGHLNSLNLEPKDVTTNIVVIGLGDHYQTLSGKQSFQQKVAFTDKFSKIYREKLTFTEKISTKSNLNSKILRELCENFRFRYEVFSNCIQDIDRLVNIRNAIAHGENSIIPDVENIKKYIDSVTKAMDFLTNEISSFLEKKDFLAISEP